MTTMPVREQSARRFLAFAATLGVVGVALNLNGDGEMLPKAIAGAGMIALIWSLHRFGRLGPDEQLVFELPEVTAGPNKKKRKKKTRAVETPSISSPDEPPAA